MANPRMSSRQYRQELGLEVPELVKPVKSKTASLQPTEHQIQSAILERLGLLKNAFFWRENSGAQASEYKDKLGNVKKRFWRSGINGIADIMGVYQGFPVAIEVKRPGKKPSIDQIAFRQRYQQCGGIYFVCTSVSEVMRQLEEEIDLRVAQIDNIYPARAVGERKE